MLEFLLFFSCFFFWSLVNINNINKANLFWIFVCFFNNLTFGGKRVDGLIGGLVNIELLGLWSQV